MYNPIKNISDSFKVTEGGYSGRKLTAFTLTSCIVALHIMYILNPEYGLLVSILIIDLVGVGFFLGLVTIANIIELKNGNVVKTTTTEIKETTAEVEKEDNNIK